MPMPYSALSAYRALERGGKQSLTDFRQALGLPARMALTASHLARPLLDNPGRVMSIAALTAVVLAGGLYAGFELRKRRLGTPPNPYRAYEKEKGRDTETGTTTELLGSSGRL